VELLRFAFVVVLMVVLAAALVSFLLMGLSKARRTRRLARLAHEQGRRFFRDDPYAVACRYAGFAMISCGHSPRAHNVTDGRLEGRPIRAFDFRCELGHGTRRVTRHFRVAAADLPAPPGDLLMWHDSDSEFAPLAARDSEGRLGAWNYRGRTDLAAAVAGALGGADPPASAVEVHGTTLMIAGRPRRGRDDYAVGGEELGVVVAAVAAAGAPTPGPAGPR